MSRRFGGALVALSVLATTLAVIAPDPASASFAGDDGPIAFAEPTSPGVCTNAVQIKVVNPDGTGLRTVTTGTHPQFGPAGRQIAFDNGGGSTASSFVVNVDGTGLRFVGSGERPTWSPDGTRLAVSRSSGIWIMPVAGGPATQLTFKDTSTPYEEGATDAGGTYRVYNFVDWMPAWSPVADVIAFTRNTVTYSTAANGFSLPIQQHLDLFVIRADGTGETRITGGPRLYVPDPDGINDLAEWSPDGAALAYRNAQAFPVGTNAFVLTPGGEPANVSGLSYPRNNQVVIPTWSPTGQVAYAASEAGTRAPFGIYVGDEQLHHAANGICDLSWGQSVETNQAPTAVATLTATDTAGRFAYSSAGSSDPEGGVLTYAWSFGDGQTSTSASGFVQYDEPGQFTATLTVTDQGAKKGEATAPAEVAAPSLTVTVTLPDEEDHNVDVDQVVKVRVTVTAGEGVGALSALHFDDPPLAIEPEGGATIESGPTPTPADEGFELQPGASKSFDYQVRATDTGATKLTAHVAGEDAAGAPVEGSGFETLVTNILGVEVTANPSELTLENTSTGPDGLPAPTPEPVVVTVTVHNPGDTPIHHVHLVLASQADETWLTIESLDPQISVKQLVELSGPDPGADIGTVGPGETSEPVTFQLEARDNGDYRVQALVAAADPTFPDPDVAPTVTAVGSVDVIIKPESLLYFEAQPDVSLLDREVGLVRTGQAIPVHGIIRNQSKAHAIDLEPLRSTLAGNAGGGGMVDQSINLPDDVFPVPLRGRIDPGETIFFRGVVQTIESGGTRATLTFTPTGALVNDDGTTTPLTTDEIKIVAPEVNVAGVTLTATDTSLEIDVSLTDRVIPPDPVDFLTLAGDFTGGAAKGSATWLAGTLGGIWWLITSIPSFLFNFSTPVLLWQTIEYLVRTWESMTPTEREDFFARIAAGIVLQTGEKYEQVKAAVNQQVQQWFEGLTAGWYGGDPRQSAFMIGEVSAQVSLEAATWYLQEAKAGQALKALATADRTVATTRMAKILEDGLRRLGGTWPLDVLQARRLWGVGEVAVENLSRLAREKGLLISVRARSAEALRWIEEFKAVLKPESIKLKSVDAIDVKYLDYAEGDLGRVILRDPPITREALEQNLTRQGASAAERQAALDRYAQRLKEASSDAPGYVKDLKAKAERGRMDVGFNHRDNFPAATAADIPTVREYRDFGLRQVEGAPAGYFEVQLADKGGTLRSVTGDIDIVAMTKADGSFLTVEERLELYRILQDMPGVTIPHPETATWIAAGDAARWKLLGKHFPGAADDGLLLQFAPDGQLRPAYLDPNLSYIDEVTGQAKIYYVGGYKTPKGVPVPPGAVSFIDETSTTARVPYVPPFAGSGCPTEFSNSDAAAMVRPLPGGGFEHYVPGTGWQPLDTSGCGFVPQAHQGAVAVRGAAGPIRDDHVLLVLPQTSLSATTAAGDGGAAINDPRVYAPDRFPDGLPAWFEPGQRVIVNPGGPNEETATVAAVDGEQLAFAAPLTEAHDAGEMVSVLPSGAAAGVAGDTLARTGTNPPVRQAVLLVLAGVGFLLASRGTRWSRRRRPLP